MWQNWPVYRHRCCTRAKLECLEENSAQVSLTEQTQSAGALSKGKPEEEQISFFIPQQSPVVEKLKKLDLMDVTPSQAIRILEELKEEIDD